MDTNQLFITLISSLSSQAWIQMGKIKNPVTDKLEKNLDAASMSIDMLSMIQEKTKNNLDEYESNSFTLRGERKIHHTKRKSYCIFI